MQANSATPRGSSTSGLVGKIRVRAERTEAALAQVLERSGDWRAETAFTSWPRISARAVRHDRAAVLCGAAGRVLAVMRAETTLLAVAWSPGMAVLPDAKAWFRLVEECKEKRATQSKRKAQKASQPCLTGWQCGVQWEELGANQHRSLTAASFLSFARAMLTGAVLC
jgi:hypothetical protein